MKGFRLWLSMLCVLVLAACGQGSVKSPDFSSELKSIAVTPNPAPSVGQGETVQFSAAAVYSSQPGQPPELRDINGEVEWTSSNPGVATIDPATGLATGGATAGTTTITATKGKVKGSVELTSEGLVLRALVITPATAVVAPKGKATYILQGRFSDSPTPRDLGIDEVINWSIDSLGTLSTTLGKTVTVTAGTAEGVATLTAIVPGRPAPFNTATAKFIVGQVESVRIEPATASQPIGLPQEFKAIASFATITGGGTIPDMEVPATWTATTAAAQQPTLDSACDSGSDASSTCIITGRAVGVVNITAVYLLDSQTFSPTATLTVTPAILTKVAIESVNPSLAILPGTPANPVRRVNVGLGSAPSFQARYTYSDGVSDLTPRSLDELVDWSISDTSGNIATITVDPDTNNVTVQTKAKTPANAPVTLTATVPTAPTIKDSVRINIGDAALESLVGIRPTKAYIAVGRSQEFVAIGHFSDGTDADVADSVVTWTSLDTSVATVNANGVATATTELAKVGQSTKIRARLNSNPSSVVEADFVVTSTRCTVPLYQTDGAQAFESTPSGICLLCGTNNISRVIDFSELTFGQINVGVAALNGSRGIDVKIDPSAPYMPIMVGSKPAFIISLPKGPLVLAEVLKQLEIQTLQYTGIVPAVVETSGDLIPLRIDLLGAQLIALEGGLTESQNQYLVAINSSLPFDGVRLKIKGGTATALSTVNVFQACANSDPVTPTLNGIGEIVTIPTLIGNTTVVGQGLTFRAKTLAGADIPPPDVTWTSSNLAVAPNPNALGNVTPIGVGTTTITATLVDQSQCLSACSATYTLTVIANYCDNEFTSPVASVQRFIEGLCVLCSTDSLANIIDGNNLTSARINVPVGLLNGGIAVRINSNSPAPFPAGQKVGFLVGQATSPLLAAEVLSQLEVRTLLDGAEAETFTLTDGLDLDLLGLNLDGGPVIGVVRIPGTTTQPFNQIELAYKSGVATALTQLHVFSACRNVNGELFE